MLKSLSTTKKQLAARLSGSSSSGSSSAGDEGVVHRHISPSEDFHHRSLGSVKVQGDQLAQLAWSSAAWQAKAPFGDISLVQADKQHMLAAVMSCKPSAQGGRYLQRMMQKELAAQLKHRDGDVQAALPGMLAALNSAFRNLHPFNGPVLDGVRIALAYVDLQHQVLHTASNGGCRIVVGRTRPDGSVGVVADVGHSVFADGSAAAAVAEATQAHARSPEGERNELLGEMRYATIRLRAGVDTVIIGSEGLWHELPSQKALLRLKHYHSEAAEACGGNAAAHLTNYALHAVAERSRRLADPRMRSLRSVGHLQSLWTGDRSMYRWGKRQPVRRRRGDVHGDLSAIVLRLAWNGTEAATLPKAPVKKATGWHGGHLASALLHPLHARSTPGGAAEAARRRWALLRLHFLSFPAASRHATLERWAEVISSAMEAARVEAHRRHAAELLLRWNPAGSSSSRMRSASLGAADQAVRLGSLGSSRAPLLPDRAPAALESVPAGQPLVSASGSVASSRSSSASSSGLSWQQRSSAPQSEASAIARTLSRRNLLAPLPAQREEEGADKAKALAVHHEWHAYEQHVSSGQQKVPESVFQGMLQQ